MGFTSWLTSASWWLFFVLTALSANLLFVRSRGFRKDRPYGLRFLFNHIGLFLALVCGFAGSADTRQWRLRVSGDEVTHEVFSPDGERARWRQGIKLEKFTVAYNLDGMPDSYEARLMVDDDEVSLRVNEPYALSLVDDLYLVDYEHVSEGETVGYCILEIVRQPWKYMQWVGICMMMLGSVLSVCTGSSAVRKEENAMTWNEFTVFAIVSAAFWIAGAVIAFRRESYSRLGCRAYRRWIVLLYRVHHRFVDYLATSSAQNDGRDTSVVLFFYHIFGIAYLSEVALPMAHVVLDRHIAGICHHQYIETRNT